MEIQNEYLGRPMFPFILITKAAYQDDFIADERSRVKINRGKNILRKAKYIYRAIRMTNNNIIIDVKIHIIPIFMLASNKDRAAIL